MEAIPLFLKKQLAEDIEKLGGISVFINANKNEQTLAKLFDQRKAVYGVRGGKIRRQLRNLAKRWSNYTRKQYKARVLEKFGVSSHKERVLDSTLASIGSPNSIKSIESNTSSTDSSSFDKSLSKKVSHFRGCHE